MAADHLTAGRLSGYHAVPMCRIRINVQDFIISEKKSAWKTFAAFQAGSFQLQTLVYFLRNFN
jgi:hypothetical protein